MNSPLSGRLVALILSTAVGLAAGRPAAALRTPSRTAADQGLAEREAELAKVEGSLGEGEVAAALAALGLTPEEVNQRLVQLSPEEVAALSDHLDQLQAAGRMGWEVVWIVLLLVSVAAAYLSIY